MEQTDPTSPEENKRVRMLKCCPYNSCKSTTIYHRKKTKKNSWTCYACGRRFTQPDRKITSHRTGKKRKAKDMRIITRDEFLNLLNRIPSMRDKSLIALYYLLGSRATEVLGNEHKQTEPLRLEQIETHQVHNSNIILFTNIPILKRKQKIYRNVPVRLADKYDRTIFKTFYAYAQTKKSTEPIYTIKACRAWQIINKHAKLFPHYFRHLRCTHLITYRGFNTTELRQYIGWADERPASWYVHLSWQDIAKK